MSTTTKTKVVATRRRYNELKTMLEDRRRAAPVRSSGQDS